MSVEAITWATGPKGLASGTKFLLVMIANACDKCGVTFQGREAFADDCECNPATVSENLKRLEAAGWIARFQRRRPNGSRTSDWIVLAPGGADRGAMRDANPTEYPDDVAAAATVTSSPRETSPRETQGEVSGDSHLGFPGGPDPSEEPSEENSAGAHANDPSDAAEVRAKWATVTPEARALVIAARDVARSRKKVEPWKAGTIVALAVEFADRDLPMQARRFTEYYVDGMGENVDVKSVPGRLRTWLGRAATKATSDKATGGRAPTPKQAADAERKARNEELRNRLMGGEAA